MSHHAQLLLFGVLFLFLTVVTSVDAVLTSIGAEYLSSSDAAILTPVSTYTTGLSLATKQGTSSTSLVSYTQSVVAVQASQVMDTYVSFSQTANYLVMFGPAGRLAVSALVTSFGTSAFPCFAPMAQTQTDTSTNVYLPAFQNQMYWTLPSSQAQAAALMFLLSQMDLFAIQQYSIRTSSTYVCEPVQKLLPQLAPTLGVKLSAAMYGTPTTVNYIQNNNVRLLYVNTQTDNNAAASIKELLASSVAISMNITYATSYELAHLSLEIYKSLNPSGGLLPYGNIFLSMPVPGVEAKEYIASQNFVEQAGSLLNAKTNVLKDIMMAGWASGLALTVALNKYTGSTFNSKAAFYNNLRNAQSSFLVGELFIGSFGICSSPMAWTQGAVCACHTGGNNVWMHTFTKQGSTYDTKPVSGSLFQYGLGMCANVRATSETTYTAPNTTDEIFRLPRTVHLLGMSLSDDAMTSYMCSQTYNTIARLANTSLFWHRSTHALRGYCLPSTTAKAPSDFTTHTGTYVTTAMMGIIPDTLLTSSTPPTGMILDFIPQTTQPRLAVANYIYVFPTLDQELFVLMSYVSGLMAGASGVCGVVRSSTKSSMTAQLLSDTLRQYGVDSTSVQQQPSGSLASSIGASCLYTFVVDAAAADASLLAKYLQEHQTSTLLVPFDDITKQYASFLAAFGSLPETVTKRLVFATNLPAWTGTTMSAADLGKARALSTVEEYVQTLAPIDQTPSAARAFVVAMLYDQLTRGTVWGQHNLQAALYGNVTLTLSGGMKIGPFTTTWPGANNKLINYGATDIAVWSFTRVVVPTTPLLAPPVTPPLAYMTASSAAMSDANRALGLRAVDPNTGEDCMPLQASSSFSRDETVRSPSSSASLPMTTPQTNSTGSAESSTPHSSSSTNVLIMLQWILVILLLLVVMYIAVLLLVACGAVSCVWRLFASARCLRGKPACTKAAEKFRSCVDGECNEDVVLQHAARNTSCAPDSSDERLACVVVEVDSWRVLWVREAESMSRAMRHYQCCVRRAVVKSQCYEMLCVEGLFVVMCATVDDGVNVACDVVRDVAGLATHDASAINAAYARYGCGANTVPGLRLRVAVHCGTGFRRMDENGRILWRGAAVEDAVRAACAAGGVGVVVLTASAKSAYTGSTPLLPCGRLGSGPASEELFAAWILGDGTTDERRDRCTRQGGNAEAALYLVAAESEANSAPSRNVCKKSLERHYESIAECDRLDDLKWMSQRFGLRILQQPEDMNEHDRYASLLNAVSRHLGSLMECRYGVPRASSRMRSRTVKIDGVDHSCVSSKISRGSGMRFNRSSRRSHSIRKEQMTNFSYPRQREEEEL